jgi:truncated hemoglobin YjbI
VRAQVNLYERLGEAALRRVSTAFYERVYADRAPLPGGGLLREAFANTTKADAAANQAAFLVERLGGPKLYTEHKGPFALIGRHAPYAGVTHEAAHRWLSHMDAALAAVPEVDEDACRRLRAFFHYTAFFIVEGRALVNPHRLVGYGGSKHDGGA